MHYLKLFHKITILESNHKYFLNRYPQHSSKSTCTRHIYTSLLHKHYIYVELYIFTDFETGLARGDGMARADAEIVLCNVIKYIKHIY